jgi:pimeloyl-ACP methyl ester carboxylesterase
MLAHRIDGDGPDLVLVHAGVTDMRMWDPLVERLEDEFRILRCDLPGFGESPVPHGPFSGSGLVTEVCEQADMLDPMVVGASYGGWVALQVDVAAQIVLLDAWWPLEHWSTDFATFAAREEELIEQGDIEGAVELNVELWAPPGYEDLIRSGQRRAFEHQLAFEPEDTDEGADLAAIEVPVIVAYGARDVPDFVAIAQQYAERIPDSVLIEIDDAGHLPALEQPDAVADIIRRAARPD